MLIRTNNRLVSQIISNHLQLSFAKLKNTGLEINIGAIKYKAVHQGENCSNSPCARVGQRITEIHDTRTKSNEKPILNQLMDVSPNKSWK